MAALDKSKLHHWLTVLKRVKTWQLLILLVAFALIAAFLMRQNNLRMVELRQAVTQADADPAGDTKIALINLQNYVSAHMNTDLGSGIYLQETYQRDYTAAVQAAATATNPNSQIYAQVELECRPVYQRTHSFPAYTQCAHDKLAQLAPGQDALSRLKTPLVDLYHYNFVSPLISFDGAGIFVLFTGAVGLVIIMRLVAYLALILLLLTRRSRI
ncbi:MAG TPA: hypothetical protein VM581_01935 [Magnetospirillaceae bacterium]|nr:hypothetical protein [Magnetospirillaceae bacterium]